MLGLETMFASFLKGVLELPQESSKAGSIADRASFIPCQGKRCDP